MLRGDGLAAFGDPAPQFEFARERGRVGADFSLIKPIPNLSGVGWLRIDAAGHTLLAQRNGETGIGIIDVASSRSLGDGLPLQGPGDTWLARDGSAAYIPGIRGMARRTLDPADHFAAACVLAGRDLTDAEWSTYLGVLGDRVATCADVLGAAASAATSPAG
jgi:hypothetical protein